MMNIKLSFGLWIGWMSWNDLQILKDVRIYLFI